MKGLEDCAAGKSVGEQTEAKHIITEIVTSKNRSFPMITFVDTPGLIDGSP